MSIRFEDHLLSLDINIKQVFIQSKAASTLSFQIKNTQKTVAFRSQKYALENGHCLVYEHCENQINGDFDNNTHTYTPQQITITVFLEQQTGNSVGGSVKFNPFQASLQEKDWELPLQNSLPDSKIVFTSRLQLISKKERLAKTKESAAEDPYNLKKSKNDPKESKRYSKKSSMNEIILPESKIKMKESYYRSKQVPGIPNRTKKLESARSANIDKYQGHAKTAGSPRFTEQTTLHRQKLFDEVEKLKKKIEEERAEKVRSISKLKMEINPKILQGETHPPDTDIGKLKEKVRNLERKQKNLQITVEDLTKDLQRNKEKLCLLERRKEELQRTVGEKDIKLRAANNTIRSLNQQLDSLSSRERIVSKKGEVKETIFKDQTKRLEERLKLAEQEVTQAINGQNETIKKMSQLQKKHQGVLKERDAKYSEQKSKNLKLREELLTHQKELQMQLNEINTRNEEITKSNILHQEKIHELDIVVAKYESQIAGLKDSLKNGRENLVKIEAENQKNQGQELSSMKKKNNELNTQVMVLKEKIKRYQKDTAETENRIKLLEENLKAKTAENQKHMSRIHSFQKELDSTREEIQRRTSEIEYGKNSVATLNEKILDLKEKLENQKNRREDSNYQLDKTTSFFKQQKESMQAEISELKWTIIKNNDIVSDLQQKLRSSSDQIMKCSEQIMGKSQRIISLEQSNKILTIQNGFLIKQKNAITLKVREGGELLKQKNSELEEERRNRMKAEQKYEEQKQRAGQFQLSNKNRSNQDDKKQKEKQEQVKQKALQYQNIEMQLFKKNQETLTLKASMQMTLREIQLTKNDYDTVKGELNLLQAERTSLKDQLADHKTKLEEVSNELMLTKEKLTMAQKKIETLKVEHEEYIQGVRGSFQNLVNEFFKEETNWNIIATTLIPFPDEKLSSLQVQLVQKRNNFMIKQKQVNSGNQHQISILQDQLKDMKTMFESRENEFKKQESQERERLKGLLYEGMLEKNNVIEQANGLAQQKEEVIRDMEKLKRQIIRREENEEELNGQLQILLLQHDSLKAENQDLSGLIFKYREEEIRIRGEYDQRTMELQEQSNKAQEKAKTEMMQRDKKIIVLEKQLMDLQQRNKLNETQKHKLKEDLQNATEKLKDSQSKFNFCQSQITKLNNIIRNHQKLQSQNKEQIDRLQNDIRKANFREESFNGTIASLQTDLMQAAIEKEKLNGDLQHLRERLQETQRLFSVKGQSSKEKIQKKMQENAGLKSRLIEKQSELSMKQFILNQKDGQISNLTLQKEEFKSVIDNQRSKIKELIEIKEVNQAKIREYGREIQRMDLQVHKTEDMLAKSNYTIITMQAQLDMMRSLQLTLKQKEAECIKLRQMKAQTDQNFIWQMKKYQQNVSLLKKELEAEKNHHKNVKEQHKISISRTESSNNEKYNTLLFQLQQERDQFQKRVQEIQAHNKSIIADLENKIQSLREDFSQSKDHERMLQEELVKREIQCTTLKKRVKDVEKSYDQFKQKYNPYYLMYEQSKAEIDHLIKTHEEKLSKVISQSRSNMVRTLNQKLTELSRKIQRMKYSLQTNLRDETYSKRELIQQFNPFFSKIREFILESEQKESDSFEVKNSNEKQVF